MLFLVWCLAFGFTVFMVVSTEVVASAVAAGSAGTIVIAGVAGIGAVSVTVAAGAGVLCLNLKRDACVCGWLVVGLGPSPGYPKVWSCLDRGRVRWCCVLSLNGNSIHPPPTVRWCGGVTSLSQ